MLRLYDYWRSSAAYRVRIALNLKSLRYESVPVDLGAGAQSAPSYLARNPQGLVPVLEHNARQITQSLAIIDYLETVFPPQQLMPADAADRARVMAMALTIACDMHPLNNLRVLKYLVNELGVDDTAKLNWYHHWIDKGFTAVETMLEDPRSGDFCHGEEPGLADLCLVPQLYNARRFDCDLEAYPKLVAIEQRCLQLEAFQQALPENQKDAP